MPEARRPPGSEADRSATNCHRIEACRGLAPLMRRAFGGPPSVLGNHPCFGFGEDWAESVKTDATTAGPISVRGPTCLRAGRIVRPRQRATAAPADADVRPHLRGEGGGRRARRGTHCGRARREARPLVLPLPFQGRSRHAGLPRPRRTLAAARLLSWLARRAGQ